MIEVKKMKFITAKVDGKKFVGIVENEKVLDLQKVSEKLPNDMIQCIEMGDRLIEIIKAYKSDFTYALEEVELLAPIPRPVKNVFCVGKNYAAHAIEMGSEADIPKHPMVFSKVPTAVIGHEEIILNHKEVTNELDYEGELGVIIGKRGKGIKIEEAMDFVFGYTIINDVSARDLQVKHQQFLLGKSLDTTCPMGPWIVHKSQIDDVHNLGIETKVNGEVRQSANTEQFIFDIPTIISTLSQGTTLEPGDIIATGTPAGVGKGFNPPKFLNPGDKIEVTIEQIGALRNQVEE